MENTDITVTFTAQEANSIPELLDAACRQLGLKAATPAAIILQKLERAAQGKKVQPLRSVEPEEVA
jgi:hypothetical protein